ncbi:hypothetical protein [Anabaena catenula]|uniref:hypothetical protein n=1 Tax=Anabaena catenula TaxID=1296320 RepID=UPI0018EFF040|nr:hypothetical protein [Anabaena catenula]
MSQIISLNILMNMFGQFIKLTPEYRGKWRLIRYWMNHQYDNAVKLRILPGGEKVFCHLSIPYEAMVWLKREEQTNLELLKDALDYSSLSILPDTWVITGYCNLYYSINRKQQC